MPGTRPLFVAALLLIASASLADTASLATYLEMARAQGINVVYSSDLVPARLRVTFDPDQPVTLDKIERALQEFDLALREISDGVYSINRAERSEPVPEIVAPEPVRPPIEELIVTSSRYQLLVRNELDSTLLTHDDLAEQPTIGGDPLKWLTRLPGNSSNGISSKPRVRGGAEDETLILFDGIRLYEPFHFNNFNSLYSAFDDRLIDTLEVFSGGFPVSMGDRMSAVMEINTRGIEPGRREAGAGVFNASYLQDGNHWMVNARRSTIDWLSGLAENDPGTPSFADVYARFEPDTGQSRWALNLLWFGDDMDLVRESGNEVASSLNGSTYLWADAEHNWSDTLGGRTWFGTTAIKDDRKAMVSDPGIVTGTLDDSRELRVWHLKHTLDYLPSPNWLAQAGIEYRYAEAEYRIRLRRQLNAAFDMLVPHDNAAVNIDQNEIGHQFALWALTRVRLLDDWSTEIGVRIDRQHYEGDLDETQTSPRISLLYHPRHNLEVRLGWGRFAQAEGLHELKVADGLSEFQTPQRAEHINLGIHRSFGNGIDARLELYRKEGLATTTYFENLTNPLTLAPELQPDRVAISPDRFVSRGIELSLAGQYLDLDWWLNYSYSSARDYIGEAIVRRTWDNKHSGNVGVSTDIANWRVAIATSFHSGWSTTPLTQIGGRVVAGPRNTERFGNFVSVDVKASRAWRLGESELRLEAGVTNLFNRKNTIGFDYEVTSDGLARKPEIGIPLAPILDVYLRF